jgi:RNAse (barnase) inhibitor barstar
MSKLLQRLEDPSRSGVYRTSRADIVADAVRGSRLNFAEVSLRGADSKEELLDRIAQALSFPGWFGRNWDALEDCLIDLSWCPAGGHVFVFEGFTLGDDVGVLIDVLAASAEFWAARNRSFFGVFVDPDRTLALADLFRED